ncbi:hypothetical protein F5148DRAFT_271634 [Russula earlei]|uniref:Uncharacterized protein n=1 Tax=Russula earlei TaxID=71964 RepID=A0ACC0U4A9_9AGAM|nr:hypothetical protein F5148DRAFT_271634 [Russula earlei]
MRRRRTHHCALIAVFRPDSLSALLGVTAWRSLLQDEDNSYAIIHNPVTEASTHGIFTLFIDSCIERRCQPSFEGAKVVCAWSSLRCNAEVVRPDFCLYFRGRYAAAGSPAKLINDGDALLSLRFMLDEDQRSRLDHPLLNPMTVQTVLLRSLSEGLVEGAGLGRVRPVGFFPTGVFYRPGQ